MPTQKLSALVALTGLVFLGGSRATLPNTGAEAGDKESHSSPQGNYCVEYSSDWKNLPTPDSAKEVFQFTLSKLPMQFVMISALETNDTVEEMIDEFKTGVQILPLEEVKELERTKRTVAGEPAVQIKLGFRAAGAAMESYWTFFTHQGIAYRVYAATTRSRIENLHTENEAILDTFQFLEERKEWLARYVGKPARTSILGGLAAFTLKRPRWAETTFTEQDLTGAHDWASFRFLRGRMNSLVVRARDARTSMEGELDAFQATLAARLSGTLEQSRQVMATPAGPVAYVVATGKLGDDDYVVRGAVFMRGKLAVEVEMTCVKSLQELTRPDWSELLTSLQVDDPAHPQRPPAFGFADDELVQPPDARLAVFLSKARQVPGLVPAYGHHFDVCSDGARIVHAEHTGVFLETLSTRKREKLPFPEGLEKQGVAISRDSAWVAVAGSEAVHLLHIPRKKVAIIPLHAQQVAFVPGANDLLACVGDDHDDGFALNPFLLHNTRLVRQKNRADLAADGNNAGVPRVLVDFPLSRVSDPTMSPDGKRLALVCNRDYPRTAAVGGHVYIGNTEGAGLQQRSDGPEEVTSLSWSPDSKWLYVVRRVAMGERGGVGIGGFSDLYRIAADGGAALNLTRSGHIKGAWATGAEMFLLIDDWQLPPGQRGIFRIPVAELETLTNNRSAPPVADARKHSQAVARRLWQHFGSKTWQDIIPTPEWLAQVAQTFADAMRAECGCTLDFTTGSLRRLRDPQQFNRSEFFTWPEVQIACGAYFGECLRRGRGAQWRIKPVPFGKSEPAPEIEDNALVRTVLPFAALRRTFRESDEDNPPWWEVSESFHDEQILLVYPEAFAATAQREATDSDYANARDALDKGEIERGLDLLARLSQKRPRNRKLASEILGLCRAARLYQREKAIVRQAVLAGNEVPDLLLSYADELAKTDLRAALVYYRRAVQSPCAPGSALVKLGKVYQQQGQ